MIFDKIKFFLLGFILIISCTSKSYDKRNLCSVDENYGMVASFNLPSNNPKILSNTTLDFSKNIHQVFDINENNHFTNKKHFSINSYILFIYTYNNSECGNVSLIGVVDNKKRILIQNIREYKINSEIRYEVRNGNIVLYKKGYFFPYNKSTLLTSEITFDFNNNNIIIVVDDGLTNW